MDLTLLFDHRFFRGPDGITFSIQNYNYALFAKRYLRVFERIHIVSRVSTRPPELRRGRSVLGPGVSIKPLHTWQGPAEFVLHGRKVTSRLDELLGLPNAVIMVVPGLLGTLAYPRLLKSGKPYAVEVVGDPYDVFAPDANTHILRGFFRWWFARNLRLQCAKAAAAAYVTEAALQRGYPPNPDAYTTYYSSIELTDEAFQDRTIPLTKWTKKKFTVVNVGTMSQLYKAQDDLIRALDKCVRQGADLNLVLVGDGEHRPHLEALARRLGLEERVNFTGQLPAGEAIRQQLDKSELFVMPSRQEGLPRAMIEAMARGLPCLGTQIGGIPELLDDENLVSVNDSQALAQKMLDVLRDPQRLAQMSERNRKKAREYHADILQERRDQLYSYLRDRTQWWLKQSSSVGF